MGLGAKATGANTGHQFFGLRTEPASEPQVLASHLSELRRGVPVVGSKLEIALEVDNRAMNVSFEPIELGELPQHAGRFRVVRWRW